jgi:hypothetical protein
VRVAADFLPDYYVIKSSGRAISAPDRPRMSIGARRRHGCRPPRRFRAMDVSGGPAACDKACMEQMFAIQQVRSMTGKEMTRVERVWLVTDAQPLETVLMRELDGVRMLRAAAAAVAKWLPLAPGATLENSIFLIDPLGNLMMRFPPAPAGATEAEKVQHYAKVKKDLAKLLKASAIG